MTDSFPPRRRPYYPPATSLLLFPRRDGLPEDFSPYWPHGLDFSGQGDFVDDARQRALTEDMDRLSAHAPDASMPQAAPRVGSNVSGGFGNEYPPASQALSLDQGEDETEAETFGSGPAGSMLLGPRPADLTQAVGDASFGDEAKPLTTAANARGDVAADTDSMAPAAADYAAPAVARDWRNQEPIHVKEGEGYFTKKQSSTARFLETPRILALEQQYWEAANADNPDASKRHETGFWVYMKNDSNSLDDIKILDRGEAIAKNGIKNAMTGRGPIIPGYTLVMDFHVHPFDQDGLTLPAPIPAKGPVPRPIPFKGAAGPHSADQSVLASEDAQQASGQLPLGTPPSFFSRSYGVPVLGVIRSHHGTYYYGPGSH